jgi:hypothetical protein
MAIKAYRSGTKICRWRWKLNLGQERQTKTGLTSWTHNLNQQTLQLNSWTRSLRTQTTMLKSSLLRGGDQVQQKWSLTTSIKTRLKRKRVRSWLSRKATQKGYRDRPKAKSHLWTLLALCSSKKSKRLRRSRNKSDLQKRKQTSSQTNHKSLLRIFKINSVKTTNSRNSSNSLRSKLLTKRAVLTDCVKRSRKRSTLQRMRSTLQMKTLWVSLRTILRSSTVQDAQLTNRKAHNERLELLCRLTRSK